MLHRWPSRTALLIALLAGGLSFGDAEAVGLNLSWDDCGANGFATRSFACDKDGGEHVIIASFFPPAEIDSLIGCEAVVDISSTPSDIPDWWQFHSLGCRDSAMVVSFDPGTPPITCTDYWDGRTFHNWTYDIGFDTAADRARLVAIATLNTQQPGGEPGPVDVGTEYFAFRIQIDHTNTLGAGSCAGCDVPICIVFNQIVLKQLDSARDVTLTMPDTRYHVIWQPPRVDCPTVVPARNRTWGSIKAIYR